MAVTATTIAIAAVALTAVATGVGTYAYVAQAEAAAEAGKAQKKIFEYNAAQAENAATNQRMQARNEANRIRDRNRRVLASQRAAVTASGLDLSSSSAQDVFFDSMVQGELDALNAIYIGEVYAQQSLGRATIDRAEGAFARMRGETQRTIGYINAGGTVLSGAGSMTSGYANYRKQSANPDF